jgi:hypothetical protein
MKIFQIENKKTAYLWLFLGVGILFFVVQRLKMDLYGMAVQCASCSMYPVIKLNQLLVEPWNRFRLHRQSIDSLQEQIAVLKKEKNDLYLKNIQMQSLLWYVDDTDLVRSFGSRYDVSDLRIAHVMVRHFPSKPIIY